VALDDVSTIFFKTFRPMRVAGGLDSLPFQSHFAPGVSPLMQIKDTQGRPWLINVNLFVAVTSPADNVSNLQPAGPVPTTLLPIQVRMTLDSVVSAMQSHFGPVASPFVKITDNEGLIWSINVNEIVAVVVGPG
jgi:hypothetical protein